MTSRPYRIRTLAFILVGLAAITGLALRIVMANSHAPSVPFAGIESMDLAVGHPIADATFDGLNEDQISAVRLRLKQCRNPVFAAPMLLNAVAVPEIADQIYRKPTYDRVDVYKGKLYRGFSRLSRIVSLIFLDSYNSQAGFFVRFYSPADCNIRRDSYIAWADLILKLGSKSEHAEETGRTGLIN